VTAALLEQLRLGGLDLLPWGADGATLRARLRFVNEHREAARVDLPSFEESVLLAELPQWLGPYLHGLKRLDQLQPGQLREALQSRLTHAQRRQFDEFAPTHVTVPTGSRIVVDYVDDNAPAIEVRMQEVFGLADTPASPVDACPSP